MPDQPTINTLLNAYGWVGTPADSIVNLPGYPLAGIVNKVALWNQLSANVWRYARANQWVWIASAGNNGQKNFTGPLPGGRPAAVPGDGTIGFPLLDGTNPAKSCNCGVFNTVVRQLAHHILGFKDAEAINSSTDKTFVTLPGTRSFDKAWKGNVRTVASDFSAIRALKFTNHSFSTGPSGAFSDATCNVPAFGNKTDIMWFDLKRAKPTVLVSNTDGWLVVDNVYSAAALPAGGPPYYLVAAEELKKVVGLFPAGGAGLTQALITGVPNMSPTNANWPSWWLLSPADLSTEFKKWAHYFLPIPGYDSGAHIG